MARLKLAPRMMKKSPASGLSSIMGTKVCALEGLRKIAVAMAARGQSTAMKSPVLRTKFALSWKARNGAKRLSCALVVMCRPRPGAIAEPTIGGERSDGWPAPNDSEAR